jgi:hypothetical protein
VNILYVVQQVIHIKRQEILYFWSLFWPFREPYCSTFMQSSVYLSSVMTTEQPWTYNNTKLISGELQTRLYMQSFTRVWIAVRNYHPRQGLTRQDLKRLNDCVKERILQGDATYELFNGNFIKWSENNSEWNCKTSITWVILAKPINYFPKSALKKKCLFQSLQDVTMHKICKYCRQFAE